MKKQCLLLFLLFPLATFAFPPSNNHQVKFIKGSLEEVQMAAAREGKLLLVYFAANWCMPCQWMEKNTYRDADLAGFVNTHYLALKVDVDETSGKLYKERFKIKHLPSILLFSSQGVLLTRQERSQDADKLLSVLKNYNNPENRIKTKTEEDEGILDSPTARISISRPALIPESAPSVSQSNNLLPPPVAYVADTYAQPSKPVFPAYHPPTPPVDKLFGIQVGVFSEYRNAIREVSRLETRFDVPVNMFAEQNKGGIRYRIMVGSFPSSEKAYLYLEKVKARGIKGFVKCTEE